MKKNRYNALISKDSITPADATAISLIRSLKKDERLSCYNKVKSSLSKSVCEFIEKSFLSE